MILVIIIILLTLAYSFLILYYWHAWKKIPEYQSDRLPGTTISVIVPARNEEKNIGTLLQGILDQSYPEQLFEIIVVDDHSEDQTNAIVKQYPGVQLVSLDDNNINSYKKKAINEGITAATNLFAVTTDADCTVGRDWLLTLAQFREENQSVFVAAPVKLGFDSSFLEKFQALDFMVLQGITAAAVHKGVHSMCNGANLAYEKKVFHEVGGFTGIDMIASGDDMLLMHKIREKFPNHVHYLKAKQAIVTSEPMKTWKEFFNQRIRWASKAFYYRDSKVFWALVLVYLFNLSFLALFIAGFFNYWFWIGLIALWVIKTLVEIPFVAAVAKFYNYSSLMKYFFFFQPFHIAYTILAGLLGQFGKYEWKGRRVR